MDGLIIKIIVNVSLALIVGIFSGALSAKIYERFKKRVLKKRAIKFYSLWKESIIDLLLEIETDLGIGNYDIREIDELKTCNGFYRHFRDEGRWMKILDELLDSPYYLRKFLNYISIFVEELKIITGNFDNLSDDVYKWYFSFINFVSDLSKISKEDLNRSDEAYKRVSEFLWSWLACQGTIVSSEYQGKDYMKYFLKKL